jgi:hypothetical protein
MGPASSRFKVRTAATAGLRRLWVTDDAKCLKEIEKENGRPKRIVADQALDIDMLKELNRGNF